MQLVRLTEGFRTNRLHLETTCPKRANLDVRKYLVDFGKQDQRVVFFSWPSYPRKAGLYQKGVIGLILSGSCPPGAYSVAGEIGFLLCFNYLPVCLLLFLL